MDLTDTHLRYLLALYRLSQTASDVGTANVARAMNVSKPSVTRMLGTLMEKGLLVRERYGKIDLTDRGMVLARTFSRRVDGLKERIPSLGLELPEALLEEAACLLAACLPPQYLDGV